MIAKVKIEFTVLLEADSRADAERQISNMDPGDILSECNDGEFIRSSFHIATVDDVTADHKPDLLAIGNDGSFFDQLDI